MSMTSAKSASRIARFRRSVHHVAAVCLWLACGTCRVLAGDADTPIADSLVTELPFAAKAITPLSGTRIVAHPETSGSGGSGGGSDQSSLLRVIDVRDGRIVAAIPASGRVNAVRGFTSSGKGPSGSGIAALIATPNSGLSLETVIGGNAQNLPPPRNVPLNQDIPDTASLQELDKGGSFAVWDDSHGDNAFIASADGSRIVSVQPDRPIRAIQPTGDEGTVLAIGDRGASLISARYGAVLESISVADILAPIATFASPPDADGNRKVLVLSGTANVLTALGTQGTHLKRLAPPAQILTADKTLDSSGLPLITADSDLEHILVSREGARRVLVFGQVGVALERRGAITLERPVQSMTTLPGAGLDGSDVFVFLADDRRTLDVIPEGRLNIRSRASSAVADMPNQTDSATETTSVLAFGRNAESVLTAQRALAGLGYQVGAIDGIMGPATRSAVRAFQLTTNLAVSGEIDSGTLSALTKSTEKGAPSADVSLAPKSDSGVDPGKYTIYVQFAGIIQHDDANALIAHLRRSGWKVPGGAERIASAAGLNEVRFGPSSDNAAAAALADALNDADWSEKGVHAKQVGIVRRGILELWISR